MCHEYADLRYLKRQAEERTKGTVREPAPTPAAEPAGDWQHGRFRLPPEDNAEFIPAPEV